MKKTLAKALALLLCTVLLLCACAPKPSPAQPDGSAPSGGGLTPPSGGEDTGPRQRRTIPYSDMQYSRPDAAAIIEQVDAIAGRLVSATAFDAVLALEEEMNVLLESFYTPYVLAYIGQYHDVTDTFFAEEMRYLTAEEVELDLHVNRFYEDLTDGPFADAYRAEVGEDFYDGMLASLVLTSDEVIQYQKERSQLQQQYNEMLGNLTVTVRGEEYSFTDLQSVESLGLYYQLYQLYTEQYMEDYTQLYYKMVQLDKQTAFELGFEDAATMYYLSYNRDYNPTDARRLFASIKEHLVPLMPEGYYSAGEVDYQTAMQALPQALEAFGPEFTECWDYMIQYGLYDCEYSENKLPGMAFSYYIGAYDAPFLFANYEGDFGDASTLVHEFGHFYDYWLHFDESVLSNLDTAETYSQGLELLMMQQYALFTDNQDHARKEVLQDMLEGALIWQSVLEEFQLRAYDLDTFDGTSLGRLYAEVMAEYGYAPFTDDTGAAHDWLMYPTVFESPFYTVSYVTSATAALQMWRQGESDWDAAVEIYQTMIHADQNLPYTQLLAQAGLRAPHEEGVIAEIATLFQEEFSDASSPVSVPEETTSQAA